MESRFNQSSRGVEGCHESRAEQSHNVQSEEGQVVSAEYKSDKDEKYPFTNIVLGNIT